jgi:hypothetical protein
LNKLLEPVDFVALQDWTKPAAALWPGRWSQQL